MRARGAEYAMITAGQQIPHEHVENPSEAAGSEGQVMRLPPDLVFRIKRQLAIVLLTEVLADGIRLDFACGDEVYGNCIQLQEYLEACGQASHQGGLVSGQLSPEPAEGRPGRHRISSRGRRDQATKFPCGRRPRVPDSPKGEGQDPPPPNRAPMSACLGEPSVQVVSDVVSPSPFHRNTNREASGTAADLRRALSRFQHCKRHGVAAGRGSADALGS
jgi:hypothetical protein